MALKVISQVYTAFGSVNLVTLVPDWADSFGVDYGLPMSSYDLSPTCVSLTDHTAIARETGVLRAASVEVFFAPLTVGSSRAVPAVHTVASVPCAPVQLSIEVTVFRAAATVTS